jgi:quinol monooxygenase YgiN
MSDTTVTVLAALRVKPGLEVQARGVLQSIVAPTREEPGCLAYELHQSADDPVEFVFYERWATEQALSTHSSSTAAHRVALRQQLGELIDGPPRVTRWRQVA